MATRDFSAVAGGRRLRLALDIYKPESRQFRHVKGVGARITVRNAEEQRRLWRAIEKTIERGDWRLDAAGAAADVVGAGADSATGA